MTGKYLDLGLVDFESTMAKLPQPKLHNYEVGFDMETTLAVPDEGEFPKSLACNITHHNKMAADLCKTWEIFAQTYAMEKNLLTLPYAL